MLCFFQYLIQNLFSLQSILQTFLKKNILIFKTFRHLRQGKKFICVKALTQNQKPQIEVEQKTCSRIRPVTEIPTQQAARATLLKVFSFIRYLQRQLKSVFDLEISRSSISFDLIVVGVYFSHWISWGTTFAAEVSQNSLNELSESFFVYLRQFFQQHFRIFCKISLSL